MDGSLSKEHIWLEELLADYTKLGPGYLSFDTGMSLQEGKLYHSTSFKDLNECSSLEHSRHYMAVS